MDMLKTHVCSILAIFKRPKHKSGMYSTAFLVLLAKLGGFKLCKVCAMESKSSLLVLQARIHSFDIARLTYQIWDISSITSRLSSRLLSIWIIHPHHSELEQCDGLYALLTVTFSANCSR